MITPPVRELYPWLVLSPETHSRVELLARTRTEALTAGAELLGCPLLSLTVVRISDQW